jgi:prolyl-tRNA synthetase
MGSYGIGPARIAAAASEQNNDEGGIVWPWSIAPFDVEIIPLTADDKAVMNTAEEIYRNLTDKKIDVLMDDRNERPGVKFKDADLIGIPWQIIVGKRTLKEGLVEFKSRKTKETERIAPSDLPGRVKEVCTGAQR